MNALVLVDNAALCEDVRRIGAAADCVLDEQNRPVGRHAWTRAPLIVLDAAAAHASVRDHLPRRSGVVLVCDGEACLADWQVAAAAGAEHVIALPDQEALLIELLGARPEAGSGLGAMVAIIGGRGGAGASTFAAALALSAAASEFRPRCLLVDGDGRGGGIDLLLGMEAEPGLRWPALVVEGGRLSAAALYGALPSVGDNLTVLACGRGKGSGDPSATAFEAVIDAGRSAGDLVVCDLPRRASPAVDVALELADLVVLMVPAELRASAASEAVAAYVSERNLNQGIVVRGPAPGGLRGSDIAAALGLPLLAAIRPEPRLADLLERGGLRIRRRSPLRMASESVLDALAQRPGARGWAA